MRTIFRKISVKDDRHSPIQNTWYFVFTKDGKETQAFHTTEGWNWDDIKFSSVPKDYITHWLEEIKLPDEKWFKKFCPDPENQEEIDYCRGVQEGARKYEDFVLAVTPNEVQK